MFTLKELNLMRKLCDSFDSSFISKDEEKRVSGIRSKICNLITLEVNKHISRRE